MDLVHVWMWILEPKLPYPTWRKIRKSTKIHNIKHWSKRFETHEASPGSSPYLEEQTKSTGSTISSVCKAGLVSKRTSFGKRNPSIWHSNRYTPSFSFVTLKNFQQESLDASYPWLLSNGTTPASRWHLGQAATPFSLALAMISGTILEPSWFCRKVTKPAVYDSWQIFSSHRWKWI